MKTLSELIREADSKTIKEMLRFSLVEKKDVNMRRDLETFGDINRGAEKNLIMIFQAVAIMSFVLFGVVWIWIDLFVALQGGVSSIIFFWFVSILKGFLDEKILNEFLDHVIDKASEQIRSSILESTTEKEVLKAFRTVYLHNKIALMSEEDRENMLTL